MVLCLSLSRTFVQNRYHKLSSDPRLVRARHLFAVGKATGGEPPQEYFCAQVFPQKISRYPPTPGYRDHKSQRVTVPHGDNPRTKMSDRASVSWSHRRAFLRFGLSCRPAYGHVSGLWTNATRRCDESPKFSAIQSTKTALHVQFLAREFFVDF